MLKLRLCKRWLLIGVLLLLAIQLWWILRPKKRKLFQNTNIRHTDWFKQLRLNSHQNRLGNGTRTNNSRITNGGRSENHVSDSVPKGPEVPVMIWWDSVYTSVDEVRKCGQYSCRVTNKRDLQSHPDVKMFIFYGSHFKPYSLPLPRRPDHMWALMHEESPRNAYILLHDPTLTIFNFTSTYSQRADYPITTQWLQCPDWLRETKYVLPLVDKNRLRSAGLAPILYVQSDCDVPSDRDTFVQLLSKYIPVDSYGSCAHNKNMPEKLRFRDNMAALDAEDFFLFAARYKFTLAMENYVCNDYITEKLWRPLRLGSVPIVFGAPNIKDFLPANNSVIIVEDFQDVEDLANFIRMLDRNNKLYRKYLRYKDKPLQNTKLKELLQSRDWLPDVCDNNKQITTQGTQHTAHKYSSIFTGYECFLCNHIHEQQLARPSKTSKTKRYVASSDQYHCPSPRKFDQNGRYSVHNDTWSTEWSRGKYEAEAMMKLYESGVTVTEQEFESLVHMLSEDEDYD